MIIDCISDLHGHYPELEGGDLLIVAGDLTASDKSEQYNDFCTWLMNQTYKKKIFIGGNHDNLFSESIPKVQECHVRWDFKNGKPLELFEYLRDSGTEFEGFKIWGSPWTKTFLGMNPKCKAFTVDTEEELGEKWKLIPDDIDILITHGPPMGILDANASFESCGSFSLRNTILSPKHFENLKLVVFGHIHERGGMQYEISSSNLKFVNCSHVNERYEPVNKPIRIIL